jgi:hypothetical protein
VELFCDFISLHAQYLDHIASNYGMNDELQRFGRKFSWPNRSTILEFSWKD